MTLYANKVTHLLKQHLRMDRLSTIIVSYNTFVDKNVFPLNFNDEVQHKTTELG